MAGIVSFLFNITLPVFLFSLFFQMRALGAGDIKLFSVTGSFLTTEQLIEVMLFSLVIAAMIGIGKIGYLCFVCREKKEKYTKIHFSIEILLASVIVIGRWVFGKT